MLLFGISFWCRSSCKPLHPHQCLTPFVNISEVNRQALYRTRSAGPNISQYIGSTRQTCNKLHFIAMHCSISHCRAKEKALVATPIFIYDFFSSITNQFYFLLCSFNSYLKTISSYHFGSNILDFSALLCQKQCACFSSTVKVLDTTPLGDIQHIPNPPIASRCYI